MNPAPPPAAPASARLNLSVKFADLLVAAGAMIILLFSWAPMTSRYYGFLGGRSLWSWLSPLGLFVILATLALLGTAAVDTWWKRDKQMAGLHRHHVQVGLALYVLVTVFGMALAGPFGMGWGALFHLFGALIAAVGAVLNHFNLLQNELSMPAGATSLTYQPAAPTIPAQPHPAHPAQSTQPTQAADTQDTTSA